jgi:hypothetical protein
MLGFLVGFAMEETMTQQQQNLIDEVLSLPAEKLPRVAEFVEKLKQETHPAVSAGGDLLTEPFIGMWKDRKELEDSTRWIRDLRKGEW